MIVFHPLHDYCTDLACSHSEVNIYVYIHVNTAHQYEQNEPSL